MKEKKIIVTGSSRGLGLHIANKLLQEQHKVIFNGRSKKKKINYISGDFSNSVSSKKIIEKSYNTLKGLDVLICNIGQSKSSLPNKETYNDWKKMFDQNFFTTINAIEASKKYLIKSRGSIICISSICGSEFIKGAPITYSVSKAALNFYAKSISHYLGRLGVRINVISPGNLMFKDSVWHKKIKKDKKKVNKIIQSNVPLNSFGSPDDISNMINYLISDKAKFINGSNFIIDGGQTIKI